MYRPRVWAEIDLGAIRENMGKVRSRLGPETKVMAVVKADAYGHGALPVARAALEAGAHALAVGDSGEAIELREAGVTAPISVLGALVDKELDDVIYHRITPTIHSIDRVRLLDRKAKSQGVRLPVHVMMDTGMGRLGILPAFAPRILGEVTSAKNLYLEGLATHFPLSALEDQSFTTGQINQFKRILGRAKEMNLEIPLLHTANSAALISVPDSHFTMVRPGAALYGIDPGNFAREGFDVRPALQLKTQVVFVKGVPKGTPISYHHTYRTTSKTRIATLPVGYNDGYPFYAGGQGRVLIRGQFAPVIGRVTMDYIMVDVGSLPPVSVGDEVILIGESEGTVIRAEELARQASLIPYAISCLLGKRVKRVYRG